jgi:hypothetical protein
MISKFVTVYPGHIDLPDMGPGCDARHGGIVREDAALYAKLAQYEDRIERIETRLGMTD